MTEALPQRERPLSSAPTIAESAEAEDKLPLAIRVGWGLGAFPMSALALATGPLLMRYMTDTLAISAALAGTLFSLSKVWNAVADPVIGHLADQVKTRWGRRLPCLLLGGISSILVMVLFYVAPVGLSLMPAYLFVMMLIFASAYTLFMVPYSAMPVEITSSYHGRSQLMALRVTFTAAGTFIGAGVAPIMLEWWGATQVGHLKMAASIAAVSLGPVLLCVWLLRKAPRSYASRQHERVSFRRGLQAAVTIRPFAWLLCSKMLYFLTLAFSLTALPFFTKHVMQLSDGWLGTFLMFQTGAVVLGQPFWLMLARRFDKRGAYLLAAGLYGAACLSFWFAGPQEPTSITMARATLMGFGGGGTFLLSQAMLPDVMEYDQLTTGHRREGTIVGVFIMVEQIANALGIALFGLILGAFGYATSFDGALVQQSDSAIYALRLCITLIPAFFILLSMATIFKYGISHNILLDLRRRSKRNGQ